MLFRVVPEKKFSEYFTVRIYGPVKSKQKLLQDLNGEIQMTEIKQQTFTLSTVKTKTFHTKCSVSCYYYYSVFTK